ncbi:hypothetical protein [Nocardia sp. NPDC050793]
MALDVAMLTEDTLPDEELADRLRAAGLSDVACVVDRTRQR